MIITHRTRTQVLIKREGLKYETTVRQIVNLSHGAYIILYSVHTLTHTLTVNAINVRGIA